jgi:hypothetical protein
LGAAALLAAAAPAVAQAPVNRSRAVPPASAQAPTWDRKFFNPAEHEQADDVTLPLPCGGAMIFRPVVTPAETRDALGDGPVQLGRSNELTGYVDYLRTQRLLGTLSKPDGSWYFLIGKYAVTTAQWNAVLAPDRCAEPTEAGLLPKSDVSWFDAVDYGRRLTEWLLKEREGALQKQGDETSFLRLPTETEWEFAARGGIVVGQAQYTAEHPFPETEPLGSYVVFREMGRSGVRPVGTRKPNPLGLYDMLGNVEQWVLEPFRTNRVGREHGQSGGLVTRGGSYATEEPSIRSSLRTEYPPYNLTTKLAFRRSVIGFRLVVAAPVLSSDQRTKALRQTWIELSQARGRTETDKPRSEPGSPGRAVEMADPADEAGRLAMTVSDQALRASLNTLRRKILVEREQRDEVRGRLFRSSVMNGTLLVRGLRQDVLLAETFEQQYRDSLERLERARRARDVVAVQQEQASLSAAQEGLERARQRRRLSTRALTDAVVLMAQDVPAEQQRAQVDRLSQELEAGDLRALAPFAAAFDRALTSYRAKPGMGDEALVRLIME